MAEATCVVEDQRAVVDDGDVGACDLLAELICEEGGMAIDGVAVGGVEEVADDGAGDLRREDDRRLLGRDTACTQSAQSTAGGFVADGDGVLQ